ncbi:MAG: GNAT family N-acetyltransferase, partial [Anaerolineales bacterium]
LAFLDQLTHYHQHEWQKRGWAGAFANEYLYQFHKDLIQNRFIKNEIQLLHIYTDQMDIGYIYSFVYNGDVLFYQSGFNYQENNNYRPGLISHYFAILHNAQKNMKTYDFLAGDSSYKRTLANDSKSIYWLCLYKKKWRYILEKISAQIKCKIQLTPTVFSVV